MPSPESPAKRITTRSSVWTVLLLTVHPASVGGVSGFVGRRAAGAATPHRTSPWRCDQVVFRACLHGCRVGRGSARPWIACGHSRDTAAPRPPDSTAGTAGIGCPRSPDRAGEVHRRDSAGTAGVRWLVHGGLRSSGGSGARRHPARHRRHGRPPTHRPPGGHRGRAAHLRVRRRPRRRPAGPRARSATSPSPSSTSCSPSTPSTSSRGRSCCATPSSASRPSSRSWSSSGSSLVGLLHAGRRGLLRWT